MKKFLLSFKVLVLTFALVLSQGCGKTGDGIPKIDGVKGPSFNILDGKVLITLKLLKVNIGVGGQITIPKTVKSTFQIMPNIVDGGTLIQVALDPEDIKGVAVADEPNALPDGRPIPGIPGGVLPSLRADTDLFNTSYYFSKTLFGIYLPFEFNTLGLGASYEFKIGGKVAGNIGIVASEPGQKNTGLLIFLRKSAMKDANLQKLLKISERNPGVMY